MKCLCFDPRQGAVQSRAAQAAERMRAHAAPGWDTLIRVPVTRDPEQVDRLAPALPALRP